jgi:phosphoribosylformylglycinamidine synthase subunit PurL
MVDSFDFFTNMSAMKENILELAEKHGLSKEEYDEILKILGREPSVTEIGMYSVMWSEHCSYKNSIAELKKLPRAGKKILISAGEENAGLVDIGHGLAVAFKIESHNHPSAVEPYQGAATGVGGIMRDIFTMGARPIASLNSLRFGNPKDPRTQYLLKGIVRGIGDYGNSFGVPTVAGDIFFDDCYNENPLVNAMSVGIVKHSEIARGSAKGIGNLVMIVGSSTGRDGIHGASFASEEISEASQAKRPSVQVGDPFTEKLLLEATLEVIRSGYVVGIQDMGAAGITCSTTEMSARAKTGMVVDLNKVPLRENDMTPYEIMLSESQERMLIVLKPEHEDNIKSIFKKWDLHCEVIGKVTDGGRVIIRMNGETVADVPAGSMALGEGAPVYYRESREPEYLQSVRKFDPNSLREPHDYNHILLRLLSSPNICSRKWVYEQYDTMVRTNTVVQGNSDAAVIRIKGTSVGLAMKTDCNPRYVYLNPYMGAQIAVAESARNVVCSGAKPIAITNCLNFGNPYDPEIFYQFKEAVRGISAACLALETPVTGGNVSFYNESPQGAIYPTPVIGMLGELESIDKTMTAHFKKPGDIIILLGTTAGHVGGSEYLKLIHNTVAGDAPAISLEFEKRLQLFCLDLINSGMIKSCHDCSDGGLAVALVESCIFNHDTNIGAEIKADIGIRKDFYLFGEDQSRIIISTDTHKAADILELARKRNIPADTIGSVTADRFKIQGIIDLPIERLWESYYKGFPVR